MTRQESLVMKGVTILMMLWGHLFYTGASADYTFFVHGEPLAKLLCRACSPVPFFLILGGYGLYKVYDNGDNKNWQRILRLYSHHIVIYLLAIGIGVIALGKIWYLGSAKLLVYNLTGYWTTFNDSMWFLLPYALLSLCSYRVFRALEKINGVVIIGISFIIHLGTSYLISRHGADFLFHKMWIYNPFLVLHFLFHFLTGAVFAREKWFEKIKEKAATFPNIRYFSGGVLFLLVVVECLFRYNFMYPIAVIACMQLLPMPTIIHNSFALLGKHSMNMWMIHTWLYCYLFHSFIYSFKSPILIFAVLTLLSLGLSFLVDGIMKAIGRAKNGLIVFYDTVISYR